MNEKLRKAIEEATRVVDWHFDRGVFVHVDDCKASQAKLLRVIEMLVEQRDEAIRVQELRDLSHPTSEYENSVVKHLTAKADAELIAALEQGEQ
jgi:hypothetical protein